MFLPRKLPITKSWIISRTANRIYLVCAVAALALFGTLFALNAAVGIFGMEAMEGSTLVRALGLLFVVPGILGAATLWVGMWYYWFGFDDSTGWFLALLGLGPFGAFFYYFFSYRRKIEAKANAVIVTTEPAAFL
jgi:hypothetical protein